MDTDTIPKPEPERIPELPPVSDKHRRVLEEGSAIARDVYEVSGVRTITHGRELPKGFSRRQRRRAPGMLFTVPRLNGETAWVFRSDESDPENPGLKYEATCKKLGGPGNILYIHPSQRHLIADTSVPVIFVEGIKKALAIITAARAASVEVLVVGILGVWNWMAGGKPIVDLFGIPIVGRWVGICFDSDMFRNPDVHDALQSFKGHLEERGATVEISHLPDQADGSKMGADDFLAGGHTYAELRATFRPYDPEAFAAERLNRNAVLRLSLEDLQRRFWAQVWKGIGGHSARDIYKLLVDISEARGKLHPDGLRVKVSRGELARMAKVSTRTLQKAIGRLEEMGLIYRDNDGRKPRERGAFVVCASVNRYGEGHADTRATQGVETDSTLGSLHLRSPRLRWSDPGRKGIAGVVKDTRRVRQTKSKPRPAIKRLGKIRGAIIDALQASGPSPLKDLADVLHRPNPRELVRAKTRPGGRNGPVIMLLEAGIVEWVCEVGTRREVLRLTPNWLEALENARRLGHEIDAEDLARTRGRLKSEAFRNQDKVEPTHHFANDPDTDGHIGELRLVDEPADVTEEITVSPLAATVKGYLDVHPSDACQPPGWIGSTLWAYELYPGKPAAAEIRAAIDELGGETYLRERLAAAKGTAA
jgi:hypothetical protein